MAGQLGHVGIDARSLDDLDKKKGSDKSDLASLVLAADSRLETLHRQTRETRSSSPDYKRKLEVTLEQVFVLAKSLVADVGHQTVQILTELKALKDQNVLLADQVSNVEGKVDGLIVVRASAAPRPDQQPALHPDLAKSLTELKHRVDGLAKQQPAVHPELAKSLSELKSQIDKQQLAHPDLIKSLANLKHQVDGLAKQQLNVHPDLVQSLTELKSQVDGLAKQQPAHPELVQSLTELKSQVDGLAKQPLQPDLPDVHPDLLQSLSDLKEKVDGLIAQAFTEPKRQPDQPNLVVKSLSELKRKVDSLAEQQPHPDLVKSLAGLKSTVDSLMVKVLAEPQPHPEQPAHPDLVNSLFELKLSGETVVLQLTKLKEQQSLTNQSLSLQVAILKANLTEKLDKVEQALKDSTDSDRLDECIRETVGSKPVFLQWLSWLHNLWYKQVPKHSSLWHPQAS